MDHYRMRNQKSCVYNMPCCEDYTLLDPHDHDIKFDSLKRRVPRKFLIILQNLITTNQSGKSKYDCKLPELDLVSMRIWYIPAGLIGVVDLTAAMRTRTTARFCR